MRFQFLDAFLDALQRFFFAQDMRDLDRAARSELLAGNGGADRPEHLSVLHLQLLWQRQQQIMDGLFFGPVIQRAECLMRGFQ